MLRRVVMVTLMAFAVLVVTGGAPALSAASTGLQAAQAQKPPAPAKPSAKPAAKPATPAQEPAKPAAKPAARAAALDGTYEGTVETPEGTENTTIELRTEGGTIKGTISTPSYPGLPLTGGTVNGDQFEATLVVGELQGTLRGTLKGDQIDGNWFVEDSSGAFSVKRKVAATATPVTAPSAAPTATPAVAPVPKPAETPAAPAGDVLTGDWDAVADAGGSTYPFTLSLKVEGEKVTGSVASEMGTTPIEGTWSNGTLSFAFVMPDGMGIVMAATLSEGKLAGSFTIGAEMTGGWAASKRK